MAEGPDVPVPRVEVHDACGNVYRYDAPGATTSYTRQEGDVVFSPHARPVQRIVRTVKIEWEEWVDV